MSANRWTWRATADAATFREDIAELVAADPVGYSVIASVLDTALETGRYPQARWFTVAAGSAAGAPLVGAAMCTPPHPVHVASCLPSVAAALVEVVAATFADPDAVTGVAGFRAGAEAFADAWCRHTGRNSHEGRALGLFELPGNPTLPYAVEGRSRLATESDLALVNRWGVAFGVAVGSVPVGAEPLTPQVAGRRVWLWEDPTGTVVSMAAATVPQGGVRRVGWVYTPPELRGRGYAAGVVQALSAAVLAEGNRCVLYTDLSNPTSNDIYQRIGYQRIGDSVEISFTA